MQVRSKRTLSTTTAPTTPYHCQQSSSIVNSTFNTMSKRTRPSPRHPTSSPITAPRRSYQQHQQQQRLRLSAFTYCRLLVPSYLILLLAAVACTTAVAATDSAAPSSSTDAGSPADAVAPPHAAALASPGAGGGSSILERFSPNCSAVAHVFLARGIAASEIPQKPKNEMGLRYCASPSVGTCCTHAMETRMAMQSRQQLEKQSREQILKMTSTLGTKAQKFNEVFRQLLQESRAEFHNMFTRTYGVIYQQNSYVFSDLFNELEKYHEHGRVNLMEVMEKFFNTLYQKMFQVLNVQYTFDEKFLHCVSEHMKELKPFGDVPDKLALQIKRSFVATRTYGQALQTAAEVAKRLVNVHLNADCTAALTKMQHCGACKGYAQKPCTNYCVNVIKGCLHYFNEFDAEWEAFAMAMDRVAERMLGSFNIVMVVEPINIQISDAIMNFQEAGPDITARVFEGCGRPALSRTQRSVSPKFSHSAASSSSSTASDAKVIRKRATVQNPAEQLESDILDIDANLDDAVVLYEKRSADQKMTANGNGNGGNGNNGNGNNNGNNNRNRNQQRRKQQQNRKNNEDDYNGHNPNFAKLVRDIRQRVKDTKKFWANLPQGICDNEEISTSSDVDGMCWNGHTIDRYMHSVTTESGRNPEFPGNPATPRQTTQVATQLSHLKNAISHLRNAYQGQDVDWSEHEDPYYSGSGSGAGSDDEDEDDDEGSGLGSSFTPTHKADHTDRPGVHINNVDDEDEEDVESRRVGVDTHTSRPGGGAHDSNGIDEEEDVGGDVDNALHEDNSSGSGAATTTGKAAQKMSLWRALLLYLMPLYMAWFGGICAELL